MLRDKRLLFVTGKGGVGKTTVAASLGLLAARRGERTIICEVSKQERLAHLFRLVGTGYQERQLAPGLFGISLDPEQCKQEWLRHELRIAVLADLLGRTRTFQYLTAAAPGLRELATLGKVWELAQLDREGAHSSPYDRVIVDAPSIGHGLAMLQAPGTFAALARVGPVNRAAMMMHDVLTDRRSTGVLVVAQGEEMSVNETLEFGDRLALEMGMDIDEIVVNALYPQRFSREDARKLGSINGRGSPGARAAVRVALSEHQRARAQRSQLRRLRRSAPAPVRTLPYLFTPELGQPELEELAGRL